MPDARGDNYVLLGQLGIKVRSGLCVSSLTHASGSDTLAAEARGWYVGKDRGRCQKLRRLDGDYDRALVTFESHRLGCTQRHTHPCGHVDPGWVLDSAERQPALHDKEHAIVKARGLGDSAAWAQMKAGYERRTHLALRASEWHVADTLCFLETLGYGAGGAAGRGRRSASVKYRGKSKGAPTGLGARDLLREERLHRALQLRISG